MIDERLLCKHGNGIFMCSGVKHIYRHRKTGEEIRRNGFGGDGKFNRDDYEWVGEEDMCEPKVKAEGWTNEDYRKATLQFFNE